MRSLALPSILVLAAVLRLWRLDQNGYGNEYYSAGVRSMATSWHNFLYTAFDPAGFVSVDKPPLALWIQVASVKLFGFHGLSVLVPQALEGVASVWLVYHLVHRRFGVSSGLVAGLFLAVTPVSVAIDRSSNTDSCLVLTLLLAAWALIRAVEDGDRRLLLLSMALLGLGFNVKMLAAFVVLPAFALVYILGTPFAWRRWLVDATASALVLATVSVSWMLVYDLTPRAKRPYAGTTDTNSISELAVGPYGIGRFVRTVRPSVAAGSELVERAPAVAALSTATAQPAADAERPAEARPRTGFARLFVRVPVGPLRLADGQLAGQMAWLLPLAVMGAVLGARRERFRRPLAPARLTLILWSAWALVYGVVYSYAGGIFHFYYLSTMAPPLAALAGIGVVSLWECYRDGGWNAALLPATLLVTVGWQLYIDATAVGGWRDLMNDLAAVRDSGAWRSRLHFVVAGGTLAAAGALLTLARRRVSDSPIRIVAAGALGMGLVLLLVMPGAWALSSVLATGSGVLPSADIARLLPADSAVRAPVVDPPNVSRLVDFLKANRHQERYLLATSSATLAAPIIVQTGDAVMARGGFHGLDPILTPEKLAGMVETNQVRFVMLGDLSLVSRRMGAEAAGRPIADWVRANGRLVDPTLWRPAGRRLGTALYDLKPTLGLVPTSASAPE